MLSADHCGLMKLLFALLTFTFFLGCFWCRQAFNRCLHVSWMEHAGAAAVSVISSPTECHILTVGLLVGSLLQLSKVSAASTLVSLLWNLSSKAAIFTLILIMPSICKVIKAHQVAASIEEITRSNIIYYDRFCFRPTICPSVALILALVCEL